MSELRNIIESAEYVYSSFTKWGLKRYVCNVEYFTEEPLEDLYYVICSILEGNNGFYDKRSLGVLLGFCVNDQFEDDKQVVYYDAAEVKMFEDILAKVESQHLIKISDNRVLITNLGRISVLEKKHYQFFVGSQAMYEHSSLKSDTPIKLLMFPFYRDMGISTNLDTTRQIWPDDDDIQNKIYFTSDELMRRLELQSKTPAQIYKAELQPYYDLETRLVPVKLYQYKGEYVPAIMNGSSLAIEATELVCEEPNSIRKENIILECLFQKLWDDKTAILDYETLEPYVELVDYEELTKDTRTVWSDEKLFNVIVDYANPTCWRNISRCCTIDVLHKYISEYKEYLDWQILTERIDDEFLLDKFLEYPWDLEVLSEDRNRKESVIEQLITLQKETEEDWNWDELEKRLSQSFVLSHLDIVKANLASYTNDTEDVRKAILNNIDKRWDWNLLEKEFDLHFIYEHIDEIGSHLSFIQLFDRVFTDADWADKFATNPSFKTALAKASKGDGVLSSAIFNDKNYIWSTKVVDLFADNELVSWSTTPYMEGFECNPYLHWTQPFFERYASNITTEEGLKCVSSHIKDVATLLSSPTFQWDWDAISSNTSLLSDIQLYTQFGTKLNWSNVLTNQTDSSFLQSIPNINTMLGNDEHAWSLFSAIASIDYVEKKFRESRYPWDWSILTKRMFQRLKLENLGNKLFVDKWDWSFLSSHVDIEFLNENLEKYNDYWDWQVLLPRILIGEKRLDDSVLDQLAVILTNISEQEKRHAAWTALTSQYSFKELKGLIKETVRKRSYWWDMNYFCQHKDFNVFRDLDDCREIVDWEILSSSSSVDSSLKYNSRLGIKEKAWHEEVRKLLVDSRNHWDFKHLSHFDSLKDEKWFITIFKDKIDWKFISQSSRIFCEKDKQKLNEIIDAFKNYIDFKALSERADVDIQQVIKINPRAEYDYNNLIERQVVNANLKLVEAMPYYPWNWQLVSTSSSFYPTASFLLSHLNYDLNWEVLSSQDNREAWSDEMLVLAVAADMSICEHIDWHRLSSRDYFPMTTDVFNTAPIKELNWKRLSSRKGIAPFIDDYADYIDWGALSANKHVITLDLSVLDKYKQHLDWSIICRKDGFKFSEDILDRFSEYIDWNLASESLDIPFSKDLVDKYKDKWNWPVLVKNKAFYNTVDISDMPYVKQTNIIGFISQFPRTITPKAYHFTHMDNAVKIIRSMKLQSRDYAEGNFSNSAGTNVYRTGKAHGFARFYFKPKSPTQFYNECLGKDTDDDYYYRKAYNNGLPKCPLPVFFIFDVQELLSVMPDLCYYSNGNMQKDSSRCFKVIEDPNRIKAREIYIDSKDTFNERQQEFLVKGELDFSKLKDVHICCYDSYQAQMLKQELKGTKWEDKVSVDFDLYEHQNKELFYKEKTDTVEISTNYKCPYEFRISYSGSQAPVVVNTKNVIRHRGNNIYVNNSIEIKKDVPYEIYFEVSSPKAGSWLIYKNR